MSSQAEAAASSDQNLTRQSSSSSRFEVKKIGETNLNASASPSITPSISRHIKMIDEPANDSSDETFEASGAGAGQSRPLLDSRGANTSTGVGAWAGGFSHPSLLKKTPKHYEHDEEDDNGNERTRQANDSGKQKKPRDIKDDEENSAATTCFQVEYDDKSQLKTIICNLGASGISSYNSCFHDFKTVPLYQKLLAEFIGSHL
jgi:hypothetical protein